ncbi:MAG TPA: FHA domain-containing protein, partial [Caulobacteraceae bacterium]|nr:FHA domain-containing protein [Caulobacteraceae bacterium]
MTLTLAITNVEKLENGVPTRLCLDRFGAIIGRSPQADWSLPDAQHYISSTHCEIDYRDGAYVLNDKSTNGTFVNGAADRVASPHTIRDGDHILIGPYDIAARLDGADAMGGPPARDAAVAPARDVWEGHGGAPVSSDVARGWDRPAPNSAISGAGAMSGNWTPPRVQAPPPAPPVSSVWNDPAAPATPASDWSSPVSAPVSLTPAPAKDPFGLGGGGAAVAARPVPEPVAPSAAWETPASVPQPAPSSGWGPSTPAG